MKETKNLAFRVPMEMWERWESERLASGYRNLQDWGIQIIEDCIGRASARCQ